MNDSPAPLQIGEFIEQLDSSGLIVSSYVLRTHEAHIRVLNPVRGDDDAHTPWRPIFGDRLDSRTQWNQASSNPELTLEGEPPMGTVDRLVLEALLQVLVDRLEAPVVVAQWEGYAGSDFPETAVRAILPPERESGVWTLPARELLQFERVPMRWWDPQFSWAVGNDIYARSVFVSAGASMIQKILDDPTIEAFKVTPDDPVDIEDL